MLAFAAHGAGAQQVPRAEDQDLRIAALYVEQAAAARQAKEAKTALELVDTALEFDPESSEAYLERGRVEEREPRGIPEAIQAFSRALSIGRWPAVSTEDRCRLDLAELLFRTRRSEEAVGQLEKIPEGRDANFSYLYARALIDSGRVAEAMRVCREASGAYPWDARFAVLRAASDPSFRARLGERFLARDNIGYFPPGVLLAVIDHSEGRALKGKLIDAYVSLYGSSAAVSLRRLLIARAVTKAEIDAFVSGGGLARGGDAEALYASLRDRKIAAYLRSKVAAFSGVSKRDLSGGDDPDETARYRAGQLTRLVLDSAHDGLPVYDISFSGGRPARATVYERDVAYRIVYRDYPFVRSVTFTRGDTRTTYAMGPESLSLPLLSPSRNGRGALLFPPLPAYPPDLSADRLFAAALSEEQVDVTTRKPESLWNLGIDGVRRLEEEWRGKTYRYEVLYNGKVKTEARRDIENKGKFEVTEYYRDGALARVVYDPEHTGRPEFTLDLLPYPVLKWDYNGDGIVDAIESRPTPSKTILEVSTKLNGVFDIVTEEATK